MSFILDASIALSWCFEDEASPATDALAQRLAADGAVVPDLWHLEVSNVLIQAMRRGRITPDGVFHRARLFESLPVITDRVEGGTIWAAVLELATKHRLSSYDARYLELALRLALPLASRDAALIAAAKAEGVSVLP